MSHNAAFGFVLLRQDDIDRLVEHPKNLRDQIIIDFSRLQALRTNEVATERWRDVDLDRLLIRVWDSKKHVPVVVPLNWRLAELLRRYRSEVSPSEDDYIVQLLYSGYGDKSGQPISAKTIQNVVKGYARDAGIFDWSRYNPTLLRAYFAANWVRQKRSLKVLQYIMRHNSLSMTFRYVGRILFWSEIKREFNRIQQKPRRINELNISKMLENPVARQCLQCPAVSVCKYADEAIHNEYAEGCRFFRQILEKAKETKLREVIERG